MAADAFISNGTCYYEAGLESDPAFIPCGNDALGHKTCCQAGDMCLSDKACFNQQYGITYLAGCSDPDYRDASCPDKPGLDDSPWVGLVTCKDTNLWSPCSQSLKPSTLTSADPCSCPETSPPVAFTDAPVLSNIAHLPKTLGGSIVWQQGYLPTTSISTSSSAPATPSSSPSSTPRNTSSSLSSPTLTPSILASVSPTQSVRPQPDPSTSLSAGAKAGIGVGVIVAVLSIIASVAALLLRRRRQRKKELRTLQDHATETQPFEPKLAGSPSTIATPAVSELDSRAARPWSMRTELEGSNGSPRSIGAAFGDAGTADGGRDGHHAASHARRGQPSQGLGLFAELQG